MVRIESVLEKVRDNTWVPPAAIAILAIIIAVVSIWVDRSFLAGQQESSVWLFSGAPSDARSLLNAVAVSIISVAGVVFSVVIVALQLSSSQFGPRILQNFTEDRSTQIVLGTFIGTFSYALLVKWSIRDSASEMESFVPALSVTIAVALAIICMFLLIYFIDHLVHFIRASNVVTRMSRAATNIAIRPFPEGVGRAVPTGEKAAAIASGAAHPLRTSFDESGYLQAIDGRLLFDLEKEAEFTVEMATEIGAYLLPGEVLAWIRTDGRRLGEKIEGQVKAAFVTGPDRTPLHDVDWALLEMKDMAVKALSPGINDPTTAILCINCIGQVLVRLGSQTPAEPLRTGKAGKIKLLTRPLPFGRAVEDAFGPIRHHGGADPAVATHLFQVLGRVGAAVREEHRTAFEHQVRELRAVALDALKDKGSAPKAIEVGADAALRKIRGDDSDVK